MWVSCATSVSLGSKQGALAVSVLYLSRSEVRRIHQDSHRRVFHYKGLHFGTLLGIPLHQRETSLYGHLWRHVGWINSKHEDLGAHFFPSAPIILIYWIRTLLPHSLYTTYTLLSLHQARILPLSILLPGVGDSWRKANQLYSAFTPPINLLDLLKFTLKQKEWYCPHYSLSEGGTTFRHILRALSLQSLNSVLDKLVSGWERSQVCTLKWVPGAWWWAPLPCRDGGMMVAHCPPWVSSTQLLQAEWGVLPLQVAVSGKDWPPCYEGGDSQRRCWRRGRRQADNRAFWRGIGVPKIVGGVKAEEVCLSTVIGPHFYQPVLPLLWLQLYKKIL